MSVLLRFFWDGPPQFPKHAYLSRFKPRARAPAIQACLVCCSVTFCIDNQMIFLLFSHWVIRFFVVVSHVFPLKCPFAGYLRHTLNNTQHTATTLGDRGVTRSAGIHRNTATEKYKTSFTATSLFNLQSTSGQIYLFVLCPTFFFFFFSDDDDDAITKPAQLLFSPVFLKKKP